MVGGAVAYQWWAKQPTAQAAAEAQEAAQAEAEAVANLEAAEAEFAAGNINGARSYAMAGTMAAKKSALYARKLNRPELCVKAGKALADWRDVVRGARKAGKRKPKTPPAVSRAAQDLASDPCKVWAYTPGAPQFESVGRRGERIPRGVKRTARHSRPQAKDAVKRWQSSEDYRGGPR
jgi:hypothetical protein